MQISRLQAVTAEAAALMDMSVSWSPPAEGCDIDEQFAEMNIALGRLAQTGETLRRQHNEMEVRAFASTSALPTCFCTHSSPAL